MQDARSIQNATVGDLLDAENDFERMWALCERNLAVVLECGPELTGSLMSMELREPTGIMEVLHGMDAWLIKLSRNAQKSGIILNPEAPEVLVPMVTDLMYQVVYDWCRCKGAYSLRRKARTLAEVAFYVAPAYRWGPERLGKQSQKTEARSCPYLMDGFASLPFFPKRADRTICLFFRYLSLDPMQRFKQRKKCVVK